MNRYDANTPKGRTPRDGVEPRVRAAAPGSALDDVYASRYYRLDTDDRVEVEYDSDADTNGDADSAAVEQAVADETPPDARSKRRKGKAADESE